MGVFSPPGSRQCSLWNFIGPSILEINDFRFFRSSEHKNFRSCDITITLCILNKIHGVSYAIRNYRYLSKLTYTLGKIPRYFFLLFTYLPIYLSFYFHKTYLPVKLYLHKHLAISKTLSLVSLSLSYLFTS